MLRATWRRATLTAFAPSPASAESEGISVPRASEVVTNVYQVSLPGTSVLVLLDDEVMIVDAGWRGAGRGVLQSLARLGRDPADVSNIVITHHHTDHLGDAAYLSDACSARVAAHRDEAPIVQGDVPPPSPFTNRVLSRLMSPLVASRQPKPVAVDRRLDDGDVLGGARVVHSPGHTSGSISIHLPRRGLLMVGDALEHRRGRLGLPSSHFTADMERAKCSIRKLAQLDFDVLCFSHYPPIRGKAGPILRKFSESLD